MPSTEKNRGEGTSRTIPDPSSLTTERAPGYPVYGVFLQLLWGALTIKTQPSFVYEGRGHDSRRRKRSLTCERREARTFKRQHVTSAAPLIGWSVR